MLVLNAIDTDIPYFITCFHFGNRVKCIAEPL